MKSKLLVLTLTLAAIVLGFAAESQAGISEAAALFLRIAPGSRPAGMGEAYVAIADDATATHWNPAGLGAYPIADSWVEVKIPDEILGIMKSHGSDSDNPDSTAADQSVSEMTPITAFASLKSGSGNDYMAYDLWVITSKGLARYDNKDWNYEEVFETKTDQTLEMIVSSYFNLDDDERIKAMSILVAEANSARKSEEIMALQTKIMAAVPEDYSLRASMVEQFDSLNAVYNQCLINWERYEVLEKEFKEAIKDSALTEKEIDRINFAVEKSRSRFLPEELTIPYSIAFVAEPTSISTAGKHLLVGTGDGLVAFNGKRWKIMTEEDGLPSTNITSIYSIGETTYIGTDLGLARYDGLRISMAADTSTIPAGPISAIGGSETNLWIVAGTDLFMYDGNRWSNSREYTAVIDDNADKIAGRFAFSQSSKEKERFITKLVELNSTREPVAEMGTANAEENTVEGGAVVVIDSTDNSATSPTEVVDTLEESAAPTLPAIDFTKPLEPGTVLRLPFVTEIKGEVTDMLVDSDNRVWIGTDYGIWMYDGQQWFTPGYKVHTVEEGQTFKDVANLKKHAGAEAASTYASRLKDLNDITESDIVAGKKILVYRNPAGVSVNSIERHGDIVFFGTEHGLIEYDGITWRRASLRGLDNAPIVGVLASDDELWFASEDKLVIKANGQTEFALMHVNWLPELANDLYYEFLGFVANKEGWGTFGGNVTFITYGSISRTNEQGIDEGTFQAYEIAGTVSYGTQLRDKLAGGISAKIIYSHLSSVGAGSEQGSGTGTAVAVDFGLMYQMTNRLNLGMAVTNIGPKISYIDAAQADPLPTNLALGFAYKVLSSDYYHFLVTAEMNKMLVGFNASFDEFKSSEGVIGNGGVEFAYSDILAVRGGYIYDDEGGIRTMTMGIGLKPLEMFKFDFAYIPSNDDVALANTLRMSLTFSL